MTTDDFELSGYCREQFVRRQFYADGYAANGQLAMWTLESVGGSMYCITLYFRGRKISRKVNLKYFREKIFSRIYCSRENFFPRKYLLAKISSRENILPRKYFPAIFFRAANM